MMINHIFVIHFIILLQLFNKGPCFDIIITSTGEGDYVFTLVCLSVCLSVG